MKEKTYKARAVNPKKALEAPAPGPGGSAAPLLVDEDTAAEILALSPTTLQKWRLTTPQRGPDYVRMGRAVRYRLPDLLRYVDASLVSGAVVSKGKAV